MRTFEKSPPFWFGAVACLLVVAGLVLMLRFRTRACALLKAAMLINILLTEVFLFYDVQFVALYGPAFNIVGLITVNGLIAQEQARVRDERAESLQAGRNDVAADRTRPLQTTPVE